MIYDEMMIDRTNNYGLIRYSALIGTNADLINVPNKKRFIFHFFSNLVFSSRKQVSNQFCEPTEASIDACRPAVKTSNPNETDKINKLNLVKTSDSNFKLDHTRKTGQTWSKQ